MSNYLTACAHGGAFKHISKDAGNEDKRKEAIRLEFQVKMAERALEKARRALVEAAARGRIHRTAISEGELNRIKRLVADFYGYPLIEVWSKRRFVPHARARQVGMYLAKTMTPRSYPEIAHHFGNYDHTTIMHGVRKIAEFLANGDDQLACELAQLREIFLSPKSEPGKNYSYMPASPRNILPNFASSAVPWSDNEIELIMNETKKRTPHKIIIRALPHRSLTALKCKVARLKKIGIIE